MRSEFYRCILKIVYTDIFLMGILLVYSASTMYFQQVYIYTCTYEGFLQSCIPLPEVKIAENALLYIVYIYIKKETTWYKKNSENL